MKDGYMHVHEGTWWIPLEGPDAGPPAPRRARARRGAGGALLAVRSRRPPPFSGAVAPRSAVVPGAAELPLWEKLWDFRVPPAVRAPAPAFCEGTRTDVHARRAASPCWLDLPRFNCSLDGRALMKHTHPHAGLCKPRARRSAGPARAPASPPRSRSRAPRPAPARPPACPQMPTLAVACPQLGQLFAGTLAPYAEAGFDLNPATMHPFYARPIEVSVDRLGPGGKLRVQGFVLMFAQEGALQKKQRFLQIPAQIAWAVKAMQLALQPALPPPGAALAAAAGGAAAAAGPPAQARPLLPPVALLPQPGGAAAAAEPAVQGQEPPAPLPLGEATAAAQHAQQEQQHPPPLPPPEAAAAAPLPHPGQQQLLGKRRWEEAGRGGCVAGAAAAAGCRSQQRLDEDAGLVASTTAATKWPPEPAATGSGAEAGAFESF